MHEKNSQTFLPHSSGDSYWPEVEFAAVFKKGSWTRALEANSKKAEQLLGEERAQKPNTTK